MMRKALYILLSAVAALAVVSCAKSLKGDRQPEEIDGGAKLSVRATLPSLAKGHMDGLDIKWDANDQIAVFASRLGVVEEFYGLIEENIGILAGNPDLNLTAAVLSWTAPEIQPLHYNLYWEGLKEVIQIDGDVTSFYQDFDPGDYIFKLSAVYEDCESDFALTPNGDDYILIEILDPTAVDETADEAIVNILKVYTLNGQAIRQASLEGLSRGVYIVPGLTQDGKLVTRKTVVTSQL